MSFGESKVYFDGSHYIAIPHTTKPKRKRPKPVEEEITIIQETEDSTLTENVDVPSFVTDNGENFSTDNQNEDTESNTTSKTDAADTSESELKPTAIVKFSPTPSLTGVVEITSPSLDIAHLFVEFNSP